MAIFISFAAGTSRFIIGAHSLDQIVFGWMLGAWLALTYFALVRDRVHKHVTDLVSGRASSSYKVLIMITSGIWTAFMLTISITFLIMKESKLKTNGEVVSEMFKDNVDCISKYDYFSTWS